VTQVGGFIFMVSHVFLKLSFNPGSEWAIGTATQSRFILPGLGSWKYQLRERMLLLHMLLESEANRRFVGTVLAEFVTHSSTTGRVVPLLFLCVRNSCILLGPNNEKNK